MAEGWSGDWQNRVERLGRKALKEPQANVAAQGLVKQPAKKSRKQKES